MNLLLACLVVIVAVPMLAKLLALVNFFSQERLVKEFAELNFPKRNRLMYDKKQGYYTIYG